MPVRPIRFIANQDSEEKLFCFENNGFETRSHRLYLLDGTPSFQLSITLF